MTKVTSNINDAIVAEFIMKEKVNNSDMAIAKYIAINGSINSEIVDSILSLFMFIESMESMYDLTVEPQIEIKSIELDFIESIEAPVQFIGTERQYNNQYKLY
jgi:hypothetical protein